MLTTASFWWCIDSSFERQLTILNITIMYSYGIPALPRLGYCYRVVLSAALAAGCGSKDGVGRVGEDHVIAFFKVQGTGTCELQKQTKRNQMKRFHTNSGITVIV